MLVRRILRPLLAGALILAGTQAIIATPADIVFRTLKGERLNELAMWDLGADGIYEIFTTSVSGNAGCYQSDTLEPVWTSNFNSETLTAPVIGDFLGNGAPIMAFASRSGTIRFIWSGSGEVIASINSSGSFSIAPSVAEFPGENRDKLVLADELGQVLIYELTPDGKAHESVKIPNTVDGSTAFSIVGSIVQPPSCDDLNHDGIPEVVVTTNSGYIEVISLTQPPTRSFARLPQQTKATTLAGLGPVTGSSNHDIVFGVNSTLCIFNWDQGTGSVKQLMQTPALGDTLGHMILTPLNHDSSSDIISTADNVIAARYMGRDMNDNQVLLDIGATQLTTTDRSFLPALPFITAGNSPAVLAVNGKGSLIKWEPLASDKVIQELGEIDPPTAFVPGGQFVPAMGLSLISWNEKTYVLSLVPIGVKPAATSPPVLTLGVSYSRNGLWGAEWASKWKAKLDKATAALKSAKASAGNLGLDTESPLDDASILRGIAPLDATAQRFVSKSPGNLMFIVGAGLIGLLLIGGAVIFFRRRP